MNQNNPRILTDIITNISQTRSKQDVFNQLNKVDQKMFQIYGRNYDPNNYIIQINKPSKQTVSLGIPKAHSLTDSLMKTTFGCQEKLAKTYLQILDQSTMIEEQEKQKRIQQAKSKFATANNFKDFCANSKPYMDTARHKSKRIVPVIDNQHDSYLKTQLMFLQKPQGGSKVNQKEYFDKHIDSVTKKINQIGGMQDTIRNMQESLSKNQIKNFKKRSLFNVNKDNNPYVMTKPQRKDSTMTGNSWMDRSKTIRQTFMDKFNIQ